MTERINHGRSHAIERHPVSNPRHREEAEFDRVMGNRNIFPERAHRAARITGEHISSLWNRLPQPVRKLIGITAIALGTMGAGAVAYEFITPDSSGPVKLPGQMLNNEGTMVPAEEHYSTTSTPLSPLPTPGK